MNRELWEPAKVRWNLKEVVFVHPDDVETVYKDEEVQVGGCVCVCRI